MPNPKLPPYHIGEQRAVALLRPIDVALAELHPRLTHHDDQIRKIEKLGYLPQDDSKIYARDILGDLAEEETWPK